MRNRRSPASPTTPSPTGSPTTGRPNDAELMRRIRQGNEKRAQDQVPKETEKDKELAEERDELVSGVQKAINFLIALVFTSMPLSEDEIDWLVVLVFICVNLVWNVFLHENTTIHMAVLLLLNFVLAQYVDHIKMIPQVAVAVPPLYYALFFTLNTSLIGGGYFFYINKTKSKEERSKRGDFVFLGVVSINFLTLVAVGVITPQQIMLAFRAVGHAIMNWSIGG